MKNSYYFPHDYHARHDPKLERLRMDIGPIGDGIYWDVVEMLYEEGGYLALKSLPLIAKALNTTEELVNKVVKDAELFSVNGNKFYSESLLERLKRIKVRVRKARISANKRWHPNAMPTHSKGNVIKVKESKVKESKVKKISNISDDEFIITLKTNPAYKDIDIDKELNKMDAWLLAHPGRQKTRRFIVKWLNKIEVPIVTRPKTTKEEKRPEPINPIEHAKVAALIHKTAEKLKAK